MRTLRCHRDVETRLYGGAFHDPSLLQTPGALALFCPQCPQPGINVLHRHPDDPSWMYRIYVAMDGNFKLQGLYMRNKQQDVLLSDGLRFMVSADQFTQYIKHTDQFRPAPVSFVCCFSVSFLLHSCNPLARHLPIGHLP
jgi:hypothetical protein